MNNIDTTTIPVQTILDIVIGVALVGWMLYRQMTWRIADTRRMLTMPIILFVIGLINLGSVAKNGLSVIDLAALAAEIVLSLAVGAVMGSIAHFRLLSPQRAQAYAESHRDRSGALANVRYESRTGWLGAALWVLLIVVRVGMEFGASSLGATMAMSTGSILIVLAANRLARAGVLALRLERHRATQPIAI